MSATGQPAMPRLRYDLNAYRFLFAALRRTQDQLGRHGNSAEDENAHISGPELLEGFRDLAREQFGLMARTVLKNWGLTATDDVGQMVFELIERGEMRKTERDQLCDFFGVYDFEEVFDRAYEIDLRHAFTTDPKPADRK